MKTFTEEEVLRIVDAMVCFDNRNDLHLLREKRWMYHDRAKQVIRENSFNTLGRIDDYDSCFLNEKKDKIESLLQQIRDLL